MPYFAGSGDQVAPAPFPTRRSSDLVEDAALQEALWRGLSGIEIIGGVSCERLVVDAERATLFFSGGASRDARLIVGADGAQSFVRRDRKSTRLNSSHMSTSYAVFCRIRRPGGSSAFPYTTLFRSRRGRGPAGGALARPFGHRDHRRRELRAPGRRCRASDAVLLRRREPRRAADRGRRRRAVLRAPRGRHRREGERVRPGGAGGELSLRAAARQHGKTVVPGRRGGARAAAFARRAGLHGVVAAER